MERLLRLEMANSELGIDFRCIHCCRVTTREGETSTAEERGESFIGGFKRTLHEATGASLEKLLRKLAEV